MRSSGGPWRGPL
uniref:Uncharacterized protein n=1 Tax=Anguilla anguilla TaxID=7936 RepID=A0A0E9Q711_ANGAN